jgi:hypothetical protein
MAFAMLAGVVLLLGLGLTIAVKMVIDARRDLEHLEDEIADARGLGLNLARDPQPETWSADDFEILREDVLHEHKSDDPYSTLTPPESWEVPREVIDTAVLRGEVDRAVPEEAADRQVLRDDLDKVDMDDADDAYATSSEESALESWEIVSDDPEEEEVYEPFTTLTHGGSAPGWEVAPRPNGDSVAHPRVVEHPSTDVQPLAAHVQDDPPVVILVVGVGFLGAGGSAVTAASRLRMPRHEFDLSTQVRRNDQGSAAVPPLSSFYDASVRRDEGVDVAGRGVPSREPWHDRPTGNGHTNGGPGDPDHIAWRPPA